MDIAVMQILKYVGWELVLQVIQGEVWLIAGPEQSVGPGVSTGMPITHPVTQRASGII
jgi:hypothetical protein